MDLKEAIQKAKTWAESKADHNVNAACALAYINALPESVEYGIEGVRTQLLYILGNLQGWRGQEARESKEEMKKASGRMKD